MTNDKLMEDKHGKLHCYCALIVNGKIHPADLIKIKEIIMEDNTNEIRD
jgi:hypothetical protein